MTLLEINLTDVLSETDPDDRVVVWAPVIREGPAGQLVGPRRKTIPLTDGVGSDEVVPGPLMVQVQCKALSDTRPREVVVPEEGPVTLTALFDSSGAFTYSPAVVGQVAQYRNDAIRAAADAGLSATAAATSETNAAGHATQTADDRRQTGEDRTQTGLDRQAAAQSATDAATSATTAEGHKTTVQTALAGALLYSGTGFPNGVVAAPVGSIYTDTAATNGAIRWIKTSGTGTTGWEVEYGDTGWRDISGNILVPVRTGARVYIRRTGAHVYLSADVLYFEETVPATTPFLAVPSGFRAVKTYRTSGAYEAGAVYTALAGTEVALRAAQVGSSRFYISYLADNPWPTSLPGTPA